MTRTLRQAQGERKNKNHHQWRNQEINGQKKSINTYSSTSSGRTER
jgi:hypothetical protein